MATKYQNVLSGTAYYHCTGPDLDGMTVRQAVQTIREAGRDPYGDIGTMIAYLQPDARRSLRVEMVPCDGGYLMSSQRIVLREYWDGKERVIRTYAW